MNLSLGDSGTGVRIRHVIALHHCETSLGSTIYTELEASGAAGKILVWAAGNDGNSSPSSFVWCSNL